MCPPSSQDVIFDGTMMWAPFVQQTIAMVRDHGRHYFRGPGYTNTDGHLVERCALLLAALFPSDILSRWLLVSRQGCKALDSTL